MGKFLDEQPKYQGKFIEDSITLDNADSVVKSSLEKRPSEIIGLIKNPTTIKHPLGAVLRTAQGALEYAQGLPSSIALDLQAGKPQDIPSNLGKVLSGQRPAQYGDVFREAKLPENVSSIAGLYTDIVLSPGGSQGIIKVGKGISSIGNVIKSVGTKGAKNIISSGKRIVESFKGSSAKDLEAKLAQRKVDISNEKNLLDQLSLSKSNEVISKVKAELPKISSNMSNAYGEGLEDIFTKLDAPVEGSQILKKNAPAITNQEVVDQLEALLSRASNDPLIVKSNAYQKAVGMLDYFKNGLSSQAGLVDESGKILKTNAPNMVDIRDLISKVREVRSTIKASTQSGSAPITAKDYFATQFDKTIGNMLKSRVEGFDELQKSYAPMANAKKVAYKFFKPLSDEDSATAFLNRIKNSSMKSSDMKLLRFLQTGGRIAGKDVSGIGDISSELMDIGTRLKNIKSGDEVRELGARIAKKASDEAFRNDVFAWILKAGGLGGGAIISTKILMKDK